MKKITLMICAGLLSAGMSAQVTASEDFEAGLPAGWGSTVNAGTCDATVDNFTFGTGPSHGSNSFFFDDDACGNGADPSNVTMTSATYDLSGTDDGTVGYQVIYQDIEAATDSFVAEYWDGAAWVNLATYDADLADPVDESFDVSASNSDFAVRWVYDDGADWSWHGSVDNFTLDFPLSSADNQISGFSMFPNPANDIVTVKAQNEIQNVSFFNILGQKVLEVVPNALSQEINIANLKAGVYIVNVLAEEQQGSYRLIKQ